MMFLFQILVIVFLPYPYLLFETIKIKVLIKAT